MAHNRMVVTAKTLDEIGLKLAKKCKNKVK
jgi:hypothetical protein